MADPTTDIGETFDDQKSRIYLMSEPEGDWDLSDNDRAACLAAANAMGEIQTLSPYLKDGETPAECVARNRADVDSLLSLLATEKAVTESLRAQLATAERERDEARADRARAERAYDTVSYERAASFERLDRAVGYTGLTPYQAEIDICIEQKIVALARVKALLPANLNDIAGGLADFLGHSGPLHDEDCPGDDTCACGYYRENNAANAAARLLDALAEVVDAPTPVPSRRVEQDEILLPERSPLRQKLAALEKTRPTRARARQRTIAARVRLLEAIGVYAFLVGEAQWKSGYRCAKGELWPRADAARAEEAERYCWRRADETLQRVKHLATAYARAIRRTPPREGR